MCSRRDTRLHIKAHAGSGPLSSYSHALIVQSPFSLRSHSLYPQPRALLLFPLSSLSLRPAPSPLLLGVLLCSCCSPWSGRQPWPCPVCFSFSALDSSRCLWMYSPSCHNKNLLSVSSTTPRSNHVLMFIQCLLFTSLFVCLQSVLL